MHVFFLAENRMFSYKYEFFLESVYVALSANFFRYLASVSIKALIDHSTS